MIRIALVSITATAVVLGVAGHAAHQRAASAGASLDYGNPTGLLSSSLAKSDAVPATSRSKSKDENPYIGLAVLTSAASGESVANIKVELKQGKSLDAIAGTKDAQVRSEANGYVRILLDFAVAQGWITSAQADADAQQVAKLIDYLMAANVSEYITDSGSGLSSLPAPATPSGA